MRNRSVFLLLFFSLSISSAPAYAADAVAFNPLWVSVKAESSSVPVGTVIAWPSHSNPQDAANWLDCNGQAISYAAYPELYSKIGGNVPNYQGLFLRGYGGQTANSGGYGNVWHTSDGLGQVQGDASRKIEAHWSSKPPDNWVNGPIGGAAYSQATGGGADSGDGEGPEVIGFDSSRVVPTANENRPVNTAVRYLIRAK